MKNKFIKLTGSILIVIGFIISITLFLSSDINFINNLQSNLVFNKFCPEISLSYLTKYKILLLKLYPISLSIIGLLTIIYNVKLSNILSNIYKAISNSIKNINSNSNYFKINSSLVYLLLLNICIRIYYIIKFPIEYDEAWTFLQFSKNGFLTSLTYYPAPNNHILYSLFTNISFYLPFNNTINLRLPAFIISILSIILFYIVSRKLIQKNIAFLITSIFSTLNPIIFYGVSARGYSIITLAFIICFYATIMLIRNTKNSYFQTKYSTYLIFGSIIGLFTMPSFIYACLSIFSFIFIYALVEKNKALFLKNIFSSIITFFLTIFLYFPLFIISGLDSVFKNRFVIPISRHEVLSKIVNHFNDTSNLFFGISLLNLMLFLIIITIYLIIKRKINFEILLCMYILISCPFIMVLHSVVPFSRTWIYIIIPTLFILGIFLNAVIENLRIYNIVYILTIAICINAIYINFNYFNETYKYPIIANTLSNEIIQNTNKNVYSNHPLIETYLDYNFKLSKSKNIVVYPENYNVGLDSTKYSNSIGYLVLSKDQKSIPQFNKINTYDKFDIYIYKKNNSDE